MYLYNAFSHDEVIKCKLFPCYWHHVQGIYRQVEQSFGIFFDLRLNKGLSKETRRRWFETCK